jgi:MFS family permease
MAAAIPWREVLAEGRARLTVGIILVEFVAAVQALVVTTIMPAVRRDLGGLEFYGLVFSGYSLAAMAATPTAGRTADRLGPGRPFLAYGALFIVATLFCGLAPSMPVLAGLRLLQGYGAGGAYTIAYAAVARSYPEAARPRVLALLAFAWIAPALLGPSLGALIASTIGWRWAFLALIPLIVLAAVLALPGLSRVTVAQLPPPPLSPRWPIQLAIGFAVLISGLSLASWITVPAVIVGALFSAPALRRILPAGTLRLRPGLPSGVVAAFSLVFGYVGADYFVPLLITGVQRGTLAQAGIVVTLGALSWSLGSWWQSRYATRVQRGSVIRVGAGILAVGLVGMLLAIPFHSIWIAAIAWVLGGTGVGAAYPTVWLAIMSAAPKGGEGTAVGSARLGETLGLAMAGGVGGVAIAIASAVHAPLALGLAAAFTIALAAVVGVAFLTPRLSPSPVSGGP